jgi:hypothetical protein
MRIIGLILCILATQACGSSDEQSVAFDGHIFTDQNDVSVYVDGVALPIEGAGFHVTWVDPSPLESTAHSLEVRRGANVVFSSDLSRSGHCNIDGVMREEASFIVSLNVQPASMRPSAVICYFYDGRDPITVED